MKDSLFHPCWFRNHSERTHDITDYYFSRVSITGTVKNLLVKISSTGTMLRLETKENTQSIVGERKQSSPQQNNAPTKNVWNKSSNLVLLSITIRTIHLGLSIYYAITTATFRPPSLPVIKRHRCPYIIEGTYAERAQVHFLFIYILNDIAVMT